MLVLFPFPNALNATRISNYIWLKSRVNVWVNIPVPWSMWNSFASQAKNQSEVMHTQYVFNPFRGFLLVSSRFLQGKKSYLFLPLSPSFPKKKQKNPAKSKKKSPAMALTSHRASRQSFDYTSIHPLLNNRRPLMSHYSPVDKVPVGR